MIVPIPRAAALERIREGIVIPACPLALDERRHFDERRQRALLRYYHAAGAGGVAISVHTTQFEIREPRHGLFKPLLEFSASAIDDAMVKISGICGQTPQAVGEAETAASFGYDFGLVSLAALGDASEDELITHCRAIGEIIPIIGFYLQTCLGGRVLSYGFWRRFAEIENAWAIKVAPFNRYRSIDVARAVADAGREDSLTLYTGNDDNIIMDLLAPHAVSTKTGTKVLRIKGGLLGQWAIWTKAAVDLLRDIHALVDSNDPVPMEMLRKNTALTDANAAVFDAANNFRGCIPGIYEILRRQGLLGSRFCLNPEADLSPGQAEEIDRVCRDYPWLTDDEFVRDHLDEWLS